MDLRDYAITEYLEQIDNFPGSTVGVVIGFTPADLHTLMHMTTDQLTKWAEVSSQEIEKMDAAAALARVPYGEKLEHKTTDGIAVGGGMMMPAAFSTLAYALLKGRSVDVYCAQEIAPKMVNYDTAKRGFMSAEAVREAPDDILGCAQSFYAATCKGFTGKGKITMYAFIKPMALI